MKRGPEQPVLLRPSTERLPPELWHHIAGHLAEGGWTEGPAAVLCFLATHRGATALLRPWLVDWLRRGLARENADVSHFVETAMGYARSHMDAFQCAVTRMLESHVDALLRELAYVFFIARIEDALCEDGTMCYVVTQELPHSIPLEQVFYDNSPVDSLCPLSTLPGLRAMDRAYIEQNIAATLDSLPRHETYTLGLAISELRKNHCDHFKAERQALWYATMGGEHTVPLAQPTGLTPLRDLVVNGVPLYAPYDSKMGVLRTGFQCHLGAWPGLTVEERRIGIVMYHTRYERHRSMLWRLKPFMPRIGRVLHRAPPSSSDDDDDDDTTTVTTTTATDSSSGDEDSSDS
jgi:hypothetical protein